MALPLRVVVASALVSLVSTDPVDAQRWILDGRPTPPPRISPAAAFDAARNESVLFGGYVSGGPALAETWILGTSGWSLRSPANAPPPCGDASAVYDERRQRVVLFGGVIDRARTSDETWEWDGTDWTRIRTPITPPPRSQAGMVYDHVRGVTLLFGGITPGLGRPALGDTWEYDGTDWTRVSTQTAPPARGGAGMAFDRGRGRTVLFAGEDASRGVFRLNDTWEFDGHDWSRIVTERSPLPRHLPVMTYDADRACVLMTGGNTFGANDGVWEYDGTDWVRVVSPGSDFRVRGGVFLVDPSRNRPAVHGGFEPPIDRQLRTYAVDGPATEMYGTSCFFVPMTLEPFSAPRIGTTYEVRVLGGAFSAPGALAVGPDVPVRLPIGRTGCFLRVRPEVLLPMPTTQSGTGQVVIPIPNDPTLRDLRLRMQHLGIEPTANRIGVVTSNGVRPRVF